MKLLKFIILLSIFMALVACPEKSEKNDKRAFRFSNNSDVDVYIYLGEVGRELGGTLYPDTAIAELRCGIPFKQREIRTYGYRGIDTMSLFIFDAGVFDAYSWDEIKNDYKILKRYDLSLQDIKKLNHIILYPPTEAMKDMKMYPPYGQ